MRRPHIRSLALAVAVVTSATGLAGTAFAAPAAAVSVVEAARTAAFAHASATGVAQGDELHAEEVLIDPEGARHVRFVRTHRGMPVLGGDLVAATASPTTRRPSTGCPSRASGAPRPRRSTTGP